MLYRLEIYFSNAAYSQNEDQEKTFKAHVSIEDILRLNLYY